MLTNHIKLAFRQLRKNSLYTAVTLIGLTVGIAAALLIFRMVRYELSFNKNFSNYDRIVRVVSEVKTPEAGVEHTVCTPIPAMAAIRQSVAPFEAMSSIREFWGMLALPDPDGGNAPLKKFNNSHDEIAFFAEPEFDRIFGLEWLAGNSATALAEPNSIVLTKRWADKFFPSVQDALGKTLLVDNQVSLVVRGVVADLPTRCDFPLTYLISWATIETYPDLFFYDETWGSCSSNYQVYALLRNAGQAEAANAALARVGETEYKSRTGEKNRTHRIQPLSELHYDERFGHSGKHTTSKTRLGILGGIGILILVMACFNFINLTTAQAALRAKEVGVRKTLGSRRRQLTAQFLTETALVVLAAVASGAALASGCAPLLKFISHVPDTEPFLSVPAVWIFLALTGALVTIFAGLYPALVLAGFKPVTALRGHADGKGSGGAPLRKSLVVLQFAIAQALIIAALITLQQLDFIRSRDLGFSQNLVYTFSIGTDSASLARQSALKQALLQIPTVESVSLSSDQPLSGNTWSSNFRYATRPDDEPYSISLKYCDVDYPRTYALQMLAGKWVAPSDTIRQGVVNETLLRKLGVQNPQEAVGQQIRLGRSTMVEITGVVRDFHTHSLREEHLPLLMTSRKIFFWEIGAKIRPDDIAGTLASIQKAYDSVLPEQVFEGRFLDERIARMYEDDNRLSATCKGFGVLAVLISCLGLFGLAAHAAQQRTKEIGIRKVLGASVTGIVGLLSKDFLKLVLVALLVAVPVAWYFMDKWLQDFAFRIGISWWVFAAAGAAAVLVAFATVGFQGTRAALADPVRSLRSE
ncbi:MAG: ABC transporter permease [Saprospiraceae bacterium]|jgi:putative ABC transport system permease protein|nr:ABC transporter permease [Saprospiraceae bacterium]